MGKTTSTTEKDSFVEERLFGDHHYKTTISDGERTVTRLGRTAEESERRASEEWDDDDDDD